MVRKINKEINIEKEINSLKNNHIPSYSRGLIRLAKNVLYKEEDLRVILVLGNNISDPYYGAYTLASIAKEMHKEKINGFQQIFNKSLELTKKITPDWRKAEIFDFIISRMGQSGISEYENVISILGSITKQEFKKKIIRKLIREMVRSGSNDYHKLFQIVETTKDKVNIIKIIANELERFGGSGLTKLEDYIINIEDPFYQIKAWTYLGFKTDNIAKGSGGKYFEIAFNELNQLDNDEDLFEVLLYISDILLKTEIIEPIRILEAGLKLSNNLYKTKFLVHFAGLIAKRDDEIAINIFTQILELVDGLDDPKTQIQILINIGKGLARAGSDKAIEVFQIAKDLSEKLPDSDKIIAKGKIEKSMVVKSSFSEKIEKLDIQKQDLIENAYLGINNNVTLGLYNTYEKKLRISHIRTIARAAPLCWAYGLDLGIFNFPIKSSQELITNISHETSLGEGGKLLTNISDENRLFISNDIKQKNLGIIIATTPHPDPKKNIDIEKINAITGKKCFLLGVGKTGLPKSVLEQADYHLDFTKKGVSLETCTALGILAYVLSNLSPEK